jgi:hypothetical protein
MQLATRRNRRPRTQLNVEVGGALAEAIAKYAEVNKVSRKRVVILALAGLGLPISEKDLRNRPTTIPHTGRRQA